MGMATSECYSKIEVGLEMRETERGDRAWREKKKGEEGGKRDLVLSAFEGWLTKKTNQQAKREGEEQKVYGKDVPRTLQR